MNNIWTKEWPTESEHYWFYGKMNPLMDENVLYYVWVNDEYDELQYICEGEEMTGNEEGVWIKCILPRLPEL